MPAVVATKVGMPSVRPEAVARERLTDLLHAAAQRPLTVVCAPAGYGKTTALVEWLARTGARRAWVSLDERDNDVRRLWAHLLAALDLALPGAMHDAQRALAGGSDLHDTVLASAVDALVEHADGGVVVVVDDYHFIEHPDCHWLLRTLIDRAPPGVRVVVSSRTAPPLRLARRRAAGTVAQIGVEQLAFDAAESELLLNGSLGLGLGPDELTAIEERVVGWPAGLALIASSLQARPDRERFVEAFARSSAKVDEYLIEEVLNATDPALRDFLCRTSILGRLSAPLCQAVLQDPSARELLAEVRRSNLFVTALDDGWVRYHDLFAELLQRELTRRSPKLIAELHQRASRWFEHAALFVDAIDHAIAAGDGSRAARLLHERWPPMFFERRFVTLRSMIARLPADRGELAGFCELLDTLCMSHQGVDLRLIAQRLDALEPYRDAPGMQPLIDQMRISPFYGDVGRAVSDGWAAWERYHDLRIRAELSGQFGIVLWFAGDHQHVHDIVEPLVSEIQHPTAQSWALATLAFVAADEDDPELAESYARQAVEAIADPGARDKLESYIAHAALADALRLHGALDQASEHLAHAAQLTSRHPASLYHAFTLVLDAQLQLARRDRATARARTATARAIIDRYPDVGVLATRLAAIEAALQRPSADALLGSQPTPAELRLLALLASDLTLREIASDHLYVSINTVTSHAQRLYRRLGVRTRTQAVAAARQRGLL
jgi:LuxR family maltose regulon positive regulatory protein